MKESTGKIFRMHGWRVDRAIHNYIYFTRYDVYIRYFLKAGRLAAKKLKDLKLTASAFGMVFNRYHAKVISPEDTKKIFSLRESLFLGPDTTERIIPFHYANRIILEEPEYIAVMDCPCRLSRNKPCEPVNVCIAVGRTTAQFWLEHGDRYHARKITQEDALQIIRDGRGRGEITTAWFKVATGARTGVICTCCRCCCGGLEAMRIARGLKHSGDLSILIPSGYKVERDRDRCNSCGTCVDVCMFEAMNKDEEGDPVYERDLCMGCGLCIEKCEQGALSYNKDFEKEYPLDLDLARRKIGGAGA